jgi:tripartite-type tricarboxylate transporter receptor subunit TctC
MGIFFRLCAIAVLGLLGLQGLSAVAQENSPIHLIHGQAAGGTTDAMARLLANEWGKRLGRNVVVETRPGAGTTIAAAAVARAPADGKTVLFTGSGHSANPFLIPNLSFDTAKDFKAVGLVAATPYLLVTTASLPVSNVAELLAYLKKNPDKATVAITSIGSSPHIAGALFRKMSGVNMELVAYKGSSAQLGDVISGRVPVAFDNIVLMGPHLKAKTLTPLAVTSKERSPLYPDIPTLAESGFPDFDIVGWFGALVVVGVPDSIVETYSTPIVAMKQDKEFLAGIEKLGASVIPGGHREAETFIQNDIKKMGAMIKELGIKLQ